MLENDAARKRCKQKTLIFCQQIVSNKHKIVSATAKRCLQYRYESSVQYCGLKAIRRGFEHVRKLFLLRKVLVNDVLMTLKSLVVLKSTLKNLESELCNKSSETFKLLRIYDAPL